MRCDAFESRLNELLDRRLRPEYDARLVAHASACPRCGETLGIQQMVISDLANPASDASPDFARRVVVRVWPAVSRPSPRPAGKRSYGIIAALAASLLVAAIPLLRGPVDSVVTTAATPPSPPARVETPVVPDQSKSAAVAVSRTAPEPRIDPFTGLARGLGQSVARSMVHVPGVTSAVGPVALIEPDALPGELAEHWESLRPLAAPVAAVVDALRKSLPSFYDRPDSRSSSVVELRRSLI